MAAQYRVDIVFHTGVNLLMGLENVAPVFKVVGYSPNAWKCAFEACECACCNRNLVGVTELLGVTDLLRLSWTSVATGMFSAETLAVTPVNFEVNPRCELQATIPIPHVLFRVVYTHRHTNSLEARCFESLHGGRTLLKGAVL